MKFNIEIDKDLMVKAQTLKVNKTRTEIIEDALKLLIAMESQKKLLNSWGKIQLDEEAFK